MAALIVGTVLALVALAYVLYPLFVDPAAASMRTRESRAEPSARDEAVAALREVEFDRETGKLSDSDYSALKGRYTAEAVAAMRAEAPELRLSSGASSGGAPGTGPGGAVPVTDDLVEAEIRRARVTVPACLTCGPRPELDAVYCSTCGKYLPGRCTGCGEAATEAGARFCANCGHTLAA